MIVSCFRPLRVAVVDTACNIMLRVDYHGLPWLLFRVFPYDNHRGRPRV